MNFSGSGRWVRLGQIALLGMFSSAAMGASESGPLRAGAARAVIDPPAEAHDGYAGVHDSLYVRTIVVDNGVHRAALVAIDTVALPGGNDFLDDVAKAARIDREYLYISATHDHNAPRLPRDARPAEPNAYYDIVFDATVGAIREAASRLRPAQVGFAEGKAWVNTNRDEFIVNGAHMGYAPERASDKTVAVVVFKDMEGKPIAIYSNYAVHAVTMYRAKTRDGLPEVTGDLPGYTNRYVEAHFDDVVSVWTSGAAGDQNPLFMANYNQDHPDVFDTGVSGYAILEVLSRRLGEEIVDLASSTANLSSDVRIWAKRSSISCPARERKFPPEPGEPGGGYMRPAHIEMVDVDTPKVIPLHLLMLNDIALAGISAELFTEIGMRIKDESVFDRTMLVTVMSPGAGYIPTDEAYLITAEKAVGNTLKPGCAGPALVSTFRELMLDYAESN